MSAFGHAMLRHWDLDPTVTYLNHGTVGVAPRRVLAAQRAIQDEIERQPARYLLRELSAVRVGRPDGRRPRLRVLADAVAPFFGARGDDLAFVDNATTGANAVLRSLPLAAGDELVLTDHGYHGVDNAALFVARERGASVRFVPLPDPVRGPDGIVAAIAGALGERTRLLLVDHIASDSALVFPVRELAAEAHRRGIPVLVDGAHAPGSIALDIPALGVDWYVGNLHKWLWTPRSCGILWAAPDRQQGLHPTVISHGLDQGMTDEFELVGTRDPSAYLATPAALEMRAEFGEQAIRDYNHDLAWRAAHLLAARWGTEFAPPRSMVGSMATIPLPAALGSTGDDAAGLRDRLLLDDGFEVHVQAKHGGLRLRVAAQVYNEIVDFERLGDAVARRAGL